MPERTFTLASATGLHARPAALLVKTVQQFAGTDVYIRKADKEVNARSLISVLSLGARAGDEITVRCEGTQAADALEALAVLIESGFHA